MGRNFLSGNYYIHIKADNNVASNITFFLKIAQIVCSADKHRLEARLFVATTLARPVLFVALLHCIQKNFPNFLQ